MREFLRNILCYIGFHRWEWKSETTLLGDGTTFIVDKGRCTNWRCRSHRWLIMNREKSNRWW